MGYAVSASLSAGKVFAVEPFRVQYEKSFRPYPDPLGYGVAVDVGPLRVDVGGREKHPQEDYEPPSFGTGNEWARPPPLGAHIDSTQKLSDVDHFFATFRPSEHPNGPPICLVYSGEAHVVVRPRGGQTQDPSKGADDGAKLSLSHQFGSIPAFGLSFMGCKNGKRWIQSKRI